MADSTRRCGPPIADPWLLTGIKFHLTRLSTSFRSSRSELAPQTRCVEPRSFDRRTSCTISCMKKKFSKRVGCGCTVHSSLNSRCGARSQVPKLPPQSTSTFWKVAYASCSSRAPANPGGTRYRRLCTVWRSQIPIAGWKIRTRREHGHGSKSRQLTRAHTSMRFRVESKLENELENSWHSRRLSPNLGTSATATFSSSVRKTESSLSS